MANSWVYWHIYIWISIYLYTYISIYLYIYASRNLYIYISIYLSLYRSVSPSIGLSLNECTYLHTHIHTYRHTSIYIYMIFIDFPTSECWKVQHNCGALLFAANKMTLKILKKSLNRWPCLMTKPQWKPWGGSEHYGDLSQIFMGVTLWQFNITMNSHHFQWVNPP